MSPSVIVRVFQRGFFVTLFKVQKNNLYLFQYLFFFREIVPKWRAYNRAHSPPPPTQSPFLPPLRPPLGIGCLAARFLFPFPRRTPSAKCRTPSCSLLIALPLPNPCPPRSAPSPVLAENVLLHRFSPHASFLPSFFFFVSFRPIKGVAPFNLCSRSMILLPFSLPHFYPAVSLFFSDVRLCFCVVHLA